jgi:hypothetical protein
LCARSLLDGSSCRGLGIQAANTITNGGIGTPKFSVYLGAAEYVANCSAITKVDARITSRAPAGIVGLIVTTSLLVRIHGAASHIIRITVTATLTTRLHPPATILTIGISITASIAVWLSPCTTARLGVPEGVSVLTEVVIAQNQNEDIRIVGRPTPFDATTSPQY